MVSRFKTPRRSWFDWSVFASVLMAHLGYWGGSAVFAVLTLVRAAHGEAAPPGDALMRTSENWPPMILPSWPFWVAAPLLVVGVVRAVRGTSSPSVTWPPAMVSAFALLAGIDGLLFALAFIDTPGWPRDSIVPGAGLCLVGALGLGSVFKRDVLSRRTRASAERLRYRRPDVEVDP